MPLADIPGRNATMIAKYGSPVVVTRRAPRPTDPTTTFNYVAIVSPQGDSAGQLRGEGVANVGTENPVLFEFDSTADVRENLDVITWNGQSYKVLRAVARQVAGLTYSIHAYAARQS